MPDWLLAGGFAVIFAIVLVIWRRGEVVGSMEVTRSAAFGKRPGRMRVTVRRSAHDGAIPAIQLQVARGAGALSVLMRPAEAARLADILDQAARKIPP